MVARRTALFTLVFVVLGCGAPEGPKADYPLAKATGTLTINGKPGADIYVVFTPLGKTKGNGAQARADTAGKFTPKDRRGGDGIAPGEYKITLATSMMADGSDIQGKTLPKLPVEFTVIDQTPLKKTVPEAGGEIVIEVKDPRIK